VYCLEPTAAAAAAAAAAVDNARDFGRIAAANAISDVYAMGGKVRQCTAACKINSLFYPFVTLVAVQQLVQPPMCKLDCSIIPASCSAEVSSSMMATSMLHCFKHCYGVDAMA
jgi:selenophosphate synthase